MQLHVEFEIISAANHNNHKRGRMPVWIKSHVTEVKHPKSICFYYVYVCVQHLWAGICPEESCYGNVCQEHNYYRNACACKWIISFHCFSAQTHPIASRLKLIHCFTAVALHNVLASQELRPVTAHVLAPSIARWTFWTPVQSKLRHGKRMICGGFTYLLWRTPELFVWSCKEARGGYMVLTAQWCRARHLSRAFRDHEWFPNETTAKAIAFTEAWLGCACYIDNILRASSLLHTTCSRRQSLLVGIGN